MVLIDRFDRELFPDECPVCGAFKALAAEGLEDPCDWCATDFKSVIVGRKQGVLVCIETPSYELGRTFIHDHAGVDYDALALWYAPADMSASEIKTRLLQTFETYMYCDEAWDDPTPQNFIDRCQALGLLPIYLRSVRA